MKRMLLILMTGLDEGWQHAVSLTLMFFANILMPFSGRNPNIYMLVLCRFTIAVCFRDLTLFLFNYPLDIEAFVIGLRRIYPVFTVYRYSVKVVNGVISQSRLEHCTQTWYVLIFEQVEVCKEGSRGVWREHYMIFVILGVLFNNIYLNETMLLILWQDWTKADSMLTLMFFANILMPFSPNIYMLAICRFICRIGILCYVICYRHVRVGVLCYVFCYMYVRVCVLCYVFCYMYVRVCVLCYVFYYRHVRVGVLCYVFCYRYVRVCVLCYVFYYRYVRVCVLC